jgi:tetratricopeptide (TPR) repeat protein
VHETHPERAAELDATVERVLAAGRSVTGRETLPPEEAEALRALGYVLGGARPARTGADPKDMLAVWNDLNDLGRALDRGETETVLAGTARVLERDPGNREAFLLRGQALVRAGRADEGLELLEELVAVQGGRGLTGAIYARCLAQAGRVDEAEAALRRFLVEEPEFAENAFNLGVLLDGQGRHAEAVAAYEQAHRLNPEAVHVLVNLALALSRLPEGEGDPERAVRLVERACELSPEDDRPRLALIDVCVAAGRSERARREAEALLARPRLRGVSREDLAAVMRRLPPR